MMRTAGLHGVADACEMRVLFAERAGLAPKREAAFDGTPSSGVKLHAFSPSGRAKDMAADGKCSGQLCRCKSRREYAARHKCG